MAFTDGNLCCIQTGYKNSLWQYDSTDAKAAIIASGYFNGAASKLRKGDFIFARGSTGGTETAHVIRVATNDGSTVTTGVADLT